MIPENPLNKMVPLMGCMGMPVSSRTKSHAHGDKIFKFGMVIGMSIRFPKTLQTSSGVHVVAGLWTVHYDRHQKMKIAHIF